MKTTIDLPDDLFIEAKQRAAELRVPLRRLVEEGLRARLAPLGAPAKGKRRRIRFVVVDGALEPSLDLEDRERMHDWICGASR